MAEADKGRPSWSRTRDPGTLQPDLDALIRHGAPDGQRSDQFMHVVGWLKDSGCTPPQIIGLLAQHPDGIAAKYGRRLDREVERCFAKADNKPRREPRPVQHPPPRERPSAAMSDDVPPEKIAEASPPERDWREDVLLDDRGEPIANLANVMVALPPVLAGQGGAGRHRRPGPRPGPALRRSRRTLPRRHPMVARRGFRARPYPGRAGGAL